MRKTLLNQKVQRTPDNSRVRLPRRLTSRRLSRFLGLCAWGVMLFLFYRLLASKQRAPEPAFNKARLAQTIGPSLAVGQLPEEVELDLPVGHRKFRARYTLDSEHQARIEKLLSSYRPDYAAFVALDAVTGRVLVLSSYTHAKGGQNENLALKASFPAASIFKIVTAAAAIDQGMLTSDSVIPFNGSNHTLYRRNVTATRAPTLPGPVCADRLPIG